AEAHTSLAEIHLRQWRWAEAEQEFRRAIALNPNYPTAHHWFSIYLRVKGQYDRRVRQDTHAGVGCARENTRLDLARC
ncbi:MAG TPA: tetratricopeptide repeat protein, partial [Pyrinomonadaceae bacterium]|nr:tetratricopeptide repeat protein [Pyrinomonadaceae bacterium]